MPREGGGCAGRGGGVRGRAVRSGDASAARPGRRDRQERGGERVAIWGSSFPAEMTAVSWRRVWPTQTWTQATWKGDSEAREVAAAIGSPGAHSVVLPRASRGLRGGGVTTAGQTRKPGGQAGGAPQGPGVELGSRTDIFTRAPARASRAPRALPGAWPGCRAARSEAGPAPATRGRPRTAAPSASGTRCGPQRPPRVTATASTPCDPDPRPPRGCLHRLPLRLSFSPPLCPRCSGPAQPHEGPPKGQFRGTESAWPQGRRGRCGETVPVCPALFPGGGSCSCPVRFAATGP